MVNSSVRRVARREAQLDAVFGCLADPTRRQILRRLARGPLTVSQIAQPYPVSLPAISKHLAVLERAELIRRSRRGRERVVQLNPAGLKSAAEHVVFYRHFWTDKLDRLQAHLEGGEG